MGEERSWSPSGSHCWETHGGRRQIQGEEPGPRRHRLNVEGKYAGVRGHICGIGTELRGRRHNSIDGVQTQKSIIESREPDILLGSEEETIGHEGQ